MCAVCVSVPGPVVANVPTYVRRCASEQVCVHALGRVGLWKAPAQT